MMRLMSSVGSPTEVSTMTMVTSPACGMPAAPMLAAVAVMLQREQMWQGHLPQPWLRQGQGTRASGPAKGVGPHHEHQGG